MIIQAYQTFTEFNQTGISALFRYPAQLDLVEAIFIPFFLITVFAITLLASYFSQLRLRGKGDFISSFAGASYFVAIIAIIMSLIGEMINLTTLIVTLSVSVVATILLLVSKPDV